jgi:hypothetical protein
MMCRLVGDHEAPPGDNLVPPSTFRTEFVHVDTGRAEDRSQRAAIELPMHGHSYRCSPVAREAHVAAFLPHDSVSERLEHAYALLARYDR